MFALEILSTINKFLWSGPLLFLLMGTHLYFTLYLRIPQLKTGKAIRMSLSPMENNSATHKVSPYAALATTLAATLGTGNIIGVSTAVALGGPGAVFWCWITGVLGMATSYAECYLGALFKEKNTENHWSGGPMYIIKNGLHNKPLAYFYAACTMVAAFGIGCTTQANSLSQTTSLTWGLSPHIVGLLAAVITGLVIVGGIKSISNVCMRIVPILGFLYIGSCIILLVLNCNYILNAVLLILSCAFVPNAVVGGIAGGALMMAARYGIARGLYTNEAGIGTAAIAAASSDTTNPSHQALVSMTAVFWDTVIMCLLTGLVIVTNLLKNPHSIDGMNETGWAAAAFSYLPIGGTTFLSLSLVAFAITTLIGWSYLGEKAVEFLTGTQRLRYYKLLYIVMIYIGAIMPMKLVWECTDLVNAIMVFPNIIALYTLRNHIKTV